MNKKLLLFPACFFISLFLSSALFAQEISISGTIIDENTKEPLAGVNIAVKGKLIGTITDAKGRFNLNTKTPPPFTLIFSNVGYALQEKEITGNETSISIQLKEQSVLGQEVVVSASRVEENLMVSPVSIEKMDILAIRESPSANFYEGLGNIKGVYMSTQSLTFTNPNTRGFNGNTNYRLNQLIDGIDNAPPGLNFAVGNIVGLSQLDVESVELLVGASSALYGPGGLNGTLLMTSKSPFEYQGLSLSLQSGVMHLGASYRDSPQGMYDMNLRFAKAINDRLAFKVNASYLSALDWHASDERDRTDLNNRSLNRQSNPGYDGVNSYGDEAYVPVNLAQIAPSAAAGAALAQGFVPGTTAYNNYVNYLITLFPNQNITRTGYAERDLVDYDTQSFKMNTSLHYRISDNLEMIVQGAYGSGTSVYTAQNRFSLQGFKYYSAKTELRGTNFFIRLWGVGEDAGKTYDAGTLAARLNEAWKPSEQWYADYIGAFTTSRILGNSLETSYAFARTQADNRGANGNILKPGVARPLPGTQEFNALFNQLRGTSIADGGALVVDKSKMYHLEGMYNFTPFIKFAEVLAGMSYRIYSINTGGTTFADTPGNPIRINQFGAYMQITKKIMSNHLKFTFSGRYDKNEYFEGRLTPRASLVYSVDSKKMHNIRASIQTAFRFPSMADQWVDLDVGLFKVIGGLPRFQNEYNLVENPVYPLDNPNPLVGSADLSKGPYIFPKFRPERVTAYEIGYKGLLFSEKLLLDTYAYYNSYNGFMASQVLVQNPNTMQEQRYLTTISTDSPVDAYGWALGLDYKLPKGYTINTNIAYNTLDVANPVFGFQSNFNSPDYRSNVGLSNRNVYKNIGFSLNWRWQNSFLWESTFGVGQIPAFHTLDAQVSYKFQKLKSILKVGGANILNHYYTTGFGNPQIGALYYVSLTFDEFLN